MINSLLEVEEHLDTPRCQYSFPCPISMYISFKNKIEDVIHSGSILGVEFKETRLTNPQVKIEILLESFIFSD